MQEQSSIPALWHEAAPQHFDQAVAWWIKLLVIVAATLIAWRWFDFPVARWTLIHHPIPDYADAKASHGDIARELMMLEQWGQWACSVLVIGAVALIDRAGRRRALAIALGCVATVLVSYLLKDLLGRSRPYVARNMGWALGTWVWGGPRMGLMQGSAWQSFPSSHTTGAFALSVGLSWFYPRARGLFMGLAVVTMVQRVLHSMHFVSDVLAGMGIAVLMTRWTLQAKLAGRVIAIMPAGLREGFLADVQRGG